MENKSNNPQAELLRGGAIFCTRANSPQRFVLRSSMMFLEEEGGILHSPDGETYYELFVVERVERHRTDTKTGWKEQHDLLVYFPHQNGTRRMTINVEYGRNSEGVFHAYNIVYEGWEFAKADTQKQLQVVPLPIEITIPFTTRSRLYRSAGNKYVISDGWTSFLFSSDGDKFVPLKTSMSSIGGGQYSGSVHDHELGLKGRIDRNTDLLVLGGLTVGSKYYPDLDQNSKGTVIDLFKDKYLLEDEVLQEHNLSVEEIQLNKDGQVRLRDQTLVYGGEKLFLKVGHPTMYTLVRTAVARTPYWLFKHPDGRHISMTYDKNRDFDKTLRLFLGSGKTLKEVAIQRVDTYLSGEVNVFTEIGTFLSAVGQDAPPTWTENSSEERTGIQQLDIAGYEFVESGQELSVSEVARKEIPVMSFATVESAIAAIRDPKRSLANYRDALAYLVDHKTDLTESISFSIPSNVCGNSDPIWNKIRKGSRQLCGCGKELEIVAAK